MLKKVEKFLEDLQNNIKYGWIDKKGNIREHIERDFMINYRLQSPEDTKKYGYGLCWECNEIQREFFTENNIKFQTIFVVINNILLKHPNHTFVMFEYNNKVYWSEATWKNHKGLHEYNTKEELIADIKKYFPDIYPHKITKKQLEKIELFAYEKPKYNIKAAEFFIHCIKGVNIEKK